MKRKYMTVNTRNYTGYIGVDEKLLFPYGSALTSINYLVKTCFKKNTQVLNALLLVMSSVLCYSHTLKRSLKSQTKAKKLMKTAPTSFQKKMYKYG